MRARGAFKDHVLRLVIPSKLGAGLKEWTKVVVVEIPLIASHNTESLW